jgi:hypothetical protein
MNQYLAYIGIGLGILLVCMVIPGLKVVSEAIFKLLFEFIVEVVKRKASFWVWLIKTLVGDHGRLFMHALQTRETLDPTEQIRLEAEGYTDDELPREGVFKRIVARGKKEWKLLTKKKKKKVA